MKAFVEQWIQAAAPFLGGELGLSIRIEAGGALAPEGPSIGFEVQFSKPEYGSFLVSVDATALAALLVETQVTDAQPDLERDRSLWQEMLRESVLAAIKSFAGQAELSGPVTISDAASGDPSAAGFIMHCGARAIQMAIADRVTVKQAAVPAPVSAPAPPPAPAPAPVPAPAERANPVEEGKLADRGLELLLDIELEASLRFGSCEMPLKEILELGPGDVIQLDRHVSDPVDLIVGDKIVARGEVVLVNGNFGLRVLEVAEPRRCLESIRCLF